MPGIPSKDASFVRETPRNYALTINKKMGKTILLVTHDPIIASSCDRIIFLKDGKVKEDLKRTGDKEQFYNEIITNWC